MHLAAHIAALIAVLSTGEERSYGSAPRGVASGQIVAQPKLLLRSSPKAP
jgi:hypothetical protein